MNDSVFNTLSAVALMCSGHFSGSLSNDLMPLKGNWDAGFEQCAVVIKELGAERTRRAEAKAAKQLSDDKARVANALAALHGKPFTAESAPVLSKQWANSCTNILTNGAEYAEGKSP